MVVGLAEGGRPWSPYDGHETKRPQRQNASTGELPPSAFVLSGP